MNKIIVGVVLLAIVVGGIVYYKKNKSTDETANMNDTSLSGSPESGLIDTSMDVNLGKKVVEEFVVNGSPYKFEPNMISVKKGTVVTIIFKNTGGTHDWKIDEFGAATKQLKAGEEETIQFTADKVGSFEYYCSVGTHRAMGMKGTLVVTE